MSLNDPYGLLASGMSPEMAAEAQGLTRRQAIMQALLDQAMQPQASPTNKGTIESKQSWLAPIAQMAKAYAAQQGLQQADAGMGNLAGRQRQAVADAMSNYERMKSGAPAQDIPLPVSGDDEGNTMPPAVKAAVPGDPRAAIASAMVNPLLARSPLVGADMKTLEKAAEPYSLRPNQQRFVGDKVVATGQPEVATVTAAGPDGLPVTQFVPKVAGGPAIPQPVKMEMVNTGATVQPVNPYKPGEAITKTESPDTVAHVGAMIRGQDLTNARQREINMIAEGTAGPEMIEKNAQAIANGQLAPLGGFALKTPMGMRVMSRVMEINPEYNAQDYSSGQAAVKAFATGKQGNSVRSFNVALSHLDTLSGLADALGNGDMPLVNKLGNAVATQTGAPAPTEFNAAKKIVGDEIVKAIVGSGGGVTDREEASKTIAAANSPAQLKGVINTYKELMRGQLGGLRQQYEQSTGRKDFDRFLSDEGKSQQRRATDKPGSVIKFDAKGNPIP